MENISLCSFVKEKPKVSGVLFREAEEEMQRVAQICARGEGGSVASAAWQPQPLRSEEMSRLSHCISPQESSRWELLPVYTSQVHQGDSPTHLFMCSSHACTHTCMHSHMHARLYVTCKTSFYSHSLVVVTWEIIFTGGPHKVTVSQFDTLWCAALSSAACAPTLILYNAGANAFTSNGEHQQHLDTIDLGPTWGQANRACLE